MATSDERRGTRRNDAEERIVAALKKIHARQQRGPGSPPPLRVVGSDPHADGRSELGEYDKARELFSDLEQRLQKQYGIAATLVDRLREGQQPGEDSGAGASQQLLRLRARAGGVAGGRFVTANERARPARLELRPSHLRDARGDAPFSPRIELEPATFVLAPGEEQTVAIALDLAGSPFRPGETLELDVDVTEDGDVIHKLWVTIRLFES